MRERRKCERQRKRDIYEVMKLEGKWQPV